MIEFMPPNPELPECVSIILCDDIYRDERTKKLVIVGTFNNINAHALPAIHQKLTVLFTLTNARGEYEIALGIENARTGDLIVEMKGPAQLPDPLKIIDFNIELVGLPIPEAGKYWVVLKANDEIIAQRPFTVTKVSQEGEGEKK